MFVKIATKFYNVLDMMTNYLSVWNLKEYKC